MKNQSTYKDFIRQENELTKLRIQAEFGIKFDGETDLNPAVENIWLNHIMEYERSIVEGKKITIGAYLDNPACRPVNELTDDEVANELQKIMELLHEKKIVIDSICGVEDREMYRFITQELFLEETDSVLPKNMIVCYVYEEFHPNDEYDLKRYTEDFFQSLSDKKDDLTYGISCGYEEEDVIKKEKLIRRLNLFRDAFEKIVVDEMEILDLQIGPEEAEVKIKFRLTVYPSPGNKHVIADEGKIIFLKLGDYWYIGDVQMAGVTN